MRIVILESPFAAETDAELEQNVEYARRAMLDCLQRGESPMVSHLLYPQVLDEDDPGERQLAIDAGLAWRKVAEMSVVYCDRGISKGMKYGIAAAEEAGIPVEYRYFDPPAGAQIVKAA